MTRRRKPGPQPRRRGLGTTDILERAEIRGIYKPHVVDVLAHRRVISTRKTIRGRIWRFARLAALRLWRWLDRRWVERGAADGALTPEQVAAAKRREAALDVRIMMIEAE